MTLAHAESYLARLRAESPSASRIIHHTSKVGANKVRFDAHDAFEVTQPWVIASRRRANGLPEILPSELSVFCIEVQRWRVRVYDESIRLRAIAEGRR